MKPRIRYDTHETVTQPEKLPSSEGGVNNTIPEQLTQSGQINYLSSGQNVYTDILGGVYSRKGSVQLGGTASLSPTYFLAQFTDSRPRIESVAVFGDTLYHFDGTQYVPVPSAPTLPAKLPCSGVYFPDIDKFFISNGTDPVLQLDQSSGTLVATAVFSIPRGKYLGYNDNHLYVGDLGVGLRNIIQLSDKGAVTFTNVSQSLQVRTTKYYLNSQVAFNGNVLGFESLSYNTIVCMTNQRAYRLSGTLQVTDENSGQVVYSPGTTYDLGSSRCVAPFSLKNVNSNVFWVGADELNGFEIYFTNGQTIGTIAGKSIKLYQQFINPNAISQACATQFGPYYKVALAYGGSQLNDTEILLDTSRSSFTNGLSITGGTVQPRAVFEPLHKPGYPISRYSLFTSSGQDFVLAGGQKTGNIHRQGVGYGDEISQVTTLSTTSTSQTLAAGEAYAYPIQLQPGVPYRGITVIASGQVKVTVETVLATVPTGTLVDPNASVIVNPSGTSLVPASNAFPSSFTVSVSTAAVLVIRPISAPVNIGISPGTGLYFHSQVWGSQNGAPSVSLSGDAPITSFATYTTAHGILNAKKKTIQTVIAAQSTAGAVIQYGIGTDGRDSSFNQKPLSLNIGNSLWASSLADADPSRLHWAVDPAYAKSSERWASITSSTTQTLFAPLYVKPAIYLAYQFFFTGYGDWRINSFTPSIDIIPSTL